MSNFVSLIRSKVSRGFMTDQAGGSLSSVPQGQIIDFEGAELRQAPSHDLHLWVKGRLPALGLELKLAPRVYKGRPDYWGIEVAVIASPPVTGQDSGAGDTQLIVDLNFEKSIPLTGITGTLGVTVIGANQVKRIDIAGESF
jgi:hypothetical protein